MTKKTAILLSLASLSLGIVLGFLIAPIKKGIEIGNNSGNTNNYYEAGDTDQNEEED